MSTQQVDSITDAAGTGAPDFPFGFTTGTSSRVWVQETNGYGSTNTVIRRYLNTIVSTGSDITYADSATLGGSFTINSDGMYAMVVVDLLSSASATGISLNSNQLTTGITLITAANRVALSTTGGAAFSEMNVFIAPLTAGDVLRVHTDGATDSGAPQHGQVMLTKLY